MQLKIISQGSFTKDLYSKIFGAKKKILEVSLSLSETEKP
jgi:hypothetical protein